MSSVDQLKINIRPEVTILSVLRHLNYRPWFALAEFIDNSLQSYIEHKDALPLVNGKPPVLQVDIRMDLQGEISIKDNAGGIALADFPRAFRPAELPPNRTGLSEFGMGMKSAACWFSKEWVVKTKSLGDAVERKVSFDINRIIELKTESITVEETQLSNPESHYTELILRRLHHPPKTRTVAKIREHLASIYRVFLRNGSMVLRLNGENLRYETPKILHAPNYRDLAGELIEWKKDIDFDFGEGQRIRGFAAIRETASTSYAGFALFRRNRLIEGSADESYRPQDIFGNSNSYRYQRLFGELHIEGFEVSHTKDGFRWEEYEELFLECLKAELERAPINLLDQAEGHRVKPSKKSLEARAIQATENVARDVEAELADLVKREQVSPTQVADLPAELPPVKVQASERLIEFEAGDQRWHITLRTSVDEDEVPWLRIAQLDEQSSGVASQHRTLTLEISLSHPFVVRYLGANNENVELFLRLAVAFSIALILSQDVTGSSPYISLAHLNTLLRDTLNKAID